MKLINKQTGGILEDVKYIDTSLTTIEIYYLDNGVLRIKTEKDYHPFLQNWRDYEQPKYPLINDKKICKAVRAWAEANDITEINVASSGNELWGGIDDWRINLGGNTFKASKPLKYTIKELCGEEEE